RPVRVGLFSDHPYKDGQVGTGYSKYIYHLSRELRHLGVEVVPLHKGANPRDVDVLHDPAAPWNAPLRPRRPLVITIHDLFPSLLPQYYGLWIRTLYLQKLRWFSHFCKRMVVDSDTGVRVSVRTPATARARAAGPAWTSESGAVA